MASTILLEKLALSGPHLTIKQYIPALVYGTAWKKERSADLVYQALCNGFTAIDTANQPKHYQEHLVGDGIRRALAEGKIQRSELYLQTKFTSVGGQDLNNIPYDPKSPISEQVKSSVESSLNHLRPSDTYSGNFHDDSYVDAVVLHSPLQTMEDTLEAWRTLEQYVPSKIRYLGISNCNLFTLMNLYENVTVKPSVVQNRFYPSTKFDIGLRKFCTDRNIIYQSFWTLTANPDLLWSVEVGQLAVQAKISKQAALYCLVLGLGNTVVLNGTKSAVHMKEDIEAIQKVNQYASSHPDEWAQITGTFQRHIGQPQHVMP